MASSKLVAVPDTVYTKAEEIGEQYDMSLKEAVRKMCREGDFDV